MKLVAGLAGGLLLVLAVGVSVYFGAGVLHHQDPQPRSQLTVKIDTDPVARMVVRMLFVTIRDGLREPRVGFASIAPSEDTIEVTIAEGVGRDQVLTRLRELSRTSGAAGATEAERFAISDASGTALRLTPTSAAMAEGLARALDQAIDVLGRRINDMGLAPAFEREGNDRIVIRVPRQSDTARLKEVITTPGKLTLRLIDVSMRPDEAKAGSMPPQSEILPDRNGVQHLVEKRVAIAGESLVDAQASYDQRTREAIVNFRFNSAGRRQFARITAEKVGSPFAVVLDGVVLTAPVIREPILGGSGQISGNFTVQSANNLAILLRSGALPAPLTIIDERAIEP
jgi:preprotein translocase subunit SecD